MTADVFDQGEREFRARLLKLESRVAAFSAEQHNSVMPHWAFSGRTPDEVYFGTAVNLEQELAERRRQARVERVRLNRQQSCEECAARDGPAERLTGESA